MSRQLTVVPVTIEDRGDGGLRVFSEALPGLVLSGSNKTAVCEAIGPAIRLLFEHKGHKITGVYPNRPMPDVLQHPSPRTVDMHVQQEQFVVEIADAA